MNKFMMILVICIAVLMTSSSTKAMGDENETTIENNGSTSSSNRENNDYYLKSVKDTIPGNEGKGMIYFISPEGEVTDSLRNWLLGQDRDIENIGKGYKVTTRIISSVSKYNAIQQETEYMTDLDPVEYKYQDREKYLTTIYLYNRKGEKRDIVRFQAYNNNLLGYRYTDSGISENGSRLYVLYMDSMNVYHVDVYDSSGIRLAETTTSEVIEGTVQISRDGRLVGYETYKRKDEELIKHFCFINTDTGEWKLCKAEGIDWEAWFSLNTKIKEGNEWRVLPAFTINLMWKKGGESKSLLILFDKVSSDLYENIRGK